MFLFIFVKISSFINTQYKLILFFMKLVLIMFYRFYMFKFSGYVCYKCENVFKGLK